MKVVGLCLIVGSFILQSCGGVKTASSQFKYVQCSTELMPMAVSKKAIKADKSREKILTKNSRKIRY